MKDISYKASHLNPTLKLICRLITLEVVLFILCSREEKNKANEKTWRISESKSWAGHVWGWWGWVSFTFLKHTLHPCLWTALLLSSDLSLILLCVLVLYSARDRHNDISTRHTGVNTESGIACVAAHSTNPLNAHCAVTGWRPGGVKPAFPHRVGFIRLQTGDLGSFVIRKRRICHCKALALYRLVKSKSTLKLQK